MKKINLDKSRFVLVHHVVVLVLALFFYVRHDMKKNQSSWFERVLVELFAPVQNGVSVAGSKIQLFWSNYLSIVDTNKENQRLSDELMSLRGQLFKLSEIEKENSRLKKILDFGKDIESKKVLAKVVGKSSSSGFEVIRINKGSRSGIKKRDTVITINGLVGYVHSVYPGYSDILTVLDQINKVDAIVTRTRSRGIVEGFNSRVCRLKYVARTEAVELGDEVITAGMGEIYPKGLKIGRITKIDKGDFGVTQSLELTPAVDFEKLEEVVVFLGKDEQKLEAKENED